MIGRLFPSRQFRVEAGAVRRFKNLPRDLRRIVFFAEDRGAWPHFEPIIRALYEIYGVSVSYLTSSHADPVLVDPPYGITPFGIGAGFMRATLFSTMEASVVVMTTPDLGHRQLRRSVHPVHYVYVHHSLVSTHMIYRKGAFDRFDTVYCAGPHHVMETRETERLYRLPPKHLVEHGYGRLETLLASRGDEGLAVSVDAPRRILVAPSWGPASLLETCGEALVERLLDGGYEVTVRPHPVTVRHQPRLIARLRDRFATCAGYSWDEQIESISSFRWADLMISDWSGAAIEFAFGLERPVLFVDVPMKINNPEYGRLSRPPFEDHIRLEIGAIVNPAQIDEAPLAIEALWRDRRRLAARARELREKWVFNVERSGEIAANNLAALIAEERISH